MGSRRGGVGHRVSTRRPSGPRPVFINHVRLLRDRLDAKASEATSAIDVGHRLVARLVALRACGAVDRR
jgi:hypothetical protein